MAKKGLIRRLSGVDDFVENIKLTKAMISSGANKKKVIDETFDEAIYRLDIKEDELDGFLAAKHKEMGRVAYMNYFISSIVLLFLFYHVFSGTGYIMITFMFALSFYFFVNGFSFALRCFQIRTKELGQLRLFMRSIKEWLPPLKS
jgi:hypothetical protein